MPLLKPFDLLTQPDIPDSINYILIESGLAQKDEKLDSKISTARSVFNKAGASLENAATQVGSIMKNGDTDAGRLKAAELVLKVHGILSELDSKPLPQITINVVGSENKTLINLVLPTI